MFNFLVKNTFYILLIKKFKFQIVNIVVSLVVILLIESIHKDLVSISTDFTEFESLFILLIKWIIILLVIFENIYILFFYRIKKETKLTNNKDSNIVNESHEDDKKKYKTTTDILLEKYINKNKRSK